MEGMDLDDIGDPEQSELPIMSFFRCEPKMAGPMINLWLACRENFEVIIEKTRR